MELLVDDVACIMYDHVCQFFNSKLLSQFNCTVHAQRRGDQEKSTQLLGRGGGQFTPYTSAVN